jgi:hypothetical protein
MNAEEARLILQCRRPCGRDDHDAAIREALDYAASDPAFMESVQQEAALDAAICNCVRNIEPPPDLKQKILVGLKVTRVRRWWQRPGWLGVAACVAVAAPLTVRFWPENTPAPTPVFASIFTLPDFRGATMQKLNAGPDVKSMASMDDVRTYLAMNSCHCSAVPENLCTCPGGPVGCAVFEWNGQNVTLICFDAGKIGEVHLFTVDASALKDRPGGPIYEVTNGWRTCSWISGDRLLLLAGSEKAATHADLEALIK